MLLLGQGETQDLFLFFFEGEYICYYWSTELEYIYTIRAAVIQYESRAFLPSLKRCGTKIRPSITCDLTVEKVSVPHGTAPLQEAVPIEFSRWKGKIVIPHQPILPIPIPITSPLARLLASPFAPADRRSSSAPMPSPPPPLLLLMQGQIG